MTRTLAYIYICYHICYRTTVHAYGNAHVQVVVTGHSLGAGTATITAILLKEQLGAHALVWRALRAL